MCVEIKDNKLRFTLQKTYIGCFMSSVDHCWAHTTAQNHSDDGYSAQAVHSPSALSLPIQCFHVWYIKSSAQQPPHVPIIV